MNDEELLAEFTETEKKYGSGEGLAFSMEYMQRAFIKWETDLTYRQLQEFKDDLQHALHAAFEAGWFAREELNTIALSAH